MVLQISRPQSDLGGSYQDTLGFDPAWVSKAPLKLVASVLDAMPDRTGKVGDIRDALESQVALHPKWSTWWTKNVRHKLMDSEHFREERAGVFKLLSKVDDIPAVPLRPAGNSGKAKTPKKGRVPKERQPSQLERAWTRWFQGETEGEPPSRGRTKEAVAALDKCDPATVGQALTRMTKCPNVSGSTKHAAASWAKLIGQASLRWRDNAWSYTSYELATATGQTLARLLESANFPQDSGRWLRQAGGLPDGQPKSWRRGFVAGVWIAVDASRDDARDWFRQALHWSAHEDSCAIVREVALGAFNSPYPTIPYSQLDRLLDFLSIEEEAEFLREIIVQAASGEAPKRSVLDYVDHKTRPKPSQERADRLNLLVLATLLLADGHEPALDGASRQIADSLANSSIAEDSVWSKLMTGGQQFIAALHEQKAEELERQRLHYETKLEQNHNETERLKREVQSLYAEITAGREVARMDILQDPLTVITETLKSLRYCYDDPRETLLGVEANLTLALRAGGGDEFGIVDEIVPYDPLRHHADQSVPAGTPVRVASPGSVMTGTVAGDRVLLKASVIVPVEVD